MRFDFAFILSFILASYSVAETVVPEAVTVPVKTQKYNGYGIPNTKFRKVKLDYSKKKQGAEPKIAPTFSDQPAKLVPKSSLQPDNRVASPAAPPPPAKLLGFGLDYGPSYNFNAQPAADGTRGEYWLHEFNPKLTIGNYTLLGDFYYYDDIKAPSKNEWIDSYIFFSHKAFDLGNYFTLMPNSVLTLPLSKLSREDIGLKYAAGAGLTFGLNTKNMGHEEFGLNYVLRYTKMVNEFDTQLDGTPVTAYQIKQRVNFSYNFTKAFMFKSRFEFNSNYSSQNVVRNSYLHYEVFNYDFNDHFSANIGHSTGSNVFSITESPSAVYFENDLKFYDPKISEIAIGLGFSI